MRTKRTVSHRTLPLSIIFALGLFSFVSAALTAPATPDSEEVTNLLSELKSDAIQLRADAEDMKSFTMNSKLSWQSHASKLTSIKENVNNSGQLLSKLQNARATASPWQQQTIDQVTPLLKDLAASVSTTIEHLNTNQNKLHFQPYKEYVATNADLATDLSGLIADFLAYGEAKNKSEELGQKLEVPRN